MIEKLKFSHYAATSILQSFNSSILQFLNFSLFYFSTIKKTHFKRKKQSRWTHTVQKGVDRVEVP